MSVPSFLGPLVQTGSNCWDCYALAGRHHETEQKYSKALRVIRIEPYMGGFSVTVTPEDKGAADYRFYAPQDGGVSFAFEEAIKELELIEGFKRGVVDTSLRRELRSPDWSNSFLGSGAITVKKISVTSKHLSDGTKVKRIIASIQQTSANLLARVWPFTGSAGLNAVRWEKAYEISKYGWQEAQEDSETVLKAFGWFDQTSAIANEALNAVLDFEREASKLKAALDVER